MLQPGKHFVRVKNCGFQPERDGYPAQLSIYFEDETGESISWYSGLGFKKDGTFSLAAFDYACNQLRGLGWDPDANNFAFEVLAHPETSPIFDREAEIVVVNEPFEGQDKIKVKFINDPNDPRRGGGEKMEPAAAKTFADKLRRSLTQAGRSVKAGRPVAPKPTAPTSPARALDDDIPF